MPRHPRIIRPDATYHVTHRGNNRDAIFREESDYHYYLELVCSAQRKFEFELYHYVLMPNHVHFILRSSTSKTISPALKWMAQMYSVHFNAVYGKTGHLWGDRFFSKEIDNDAYLLTAGIYVELNPVRAGLVDDPKKYDWSSHTFYTDNSSKVPLNPSQSYLGLDQSPSQRRAIYNALTRMWQNVRAYTAP
jgi:putative transposase